MVKKEMEIRGIVGFSILTLSIKYGYGKMLIMTAKNIMTKILESIKLKSVR